MSKFFGSVNEVDSHKKLRQSDLALEKFWITQYGCLRLFTAVDMGMKISDCWKLFCYGIKREHHEKFIGIREFSERIAIYYFSNEFTKDTRTLENNITYSDEIDNEGTVSTCRILNYSSSSPRNSDISTISEITIFITTAIGHTALKEFEKVGGSYKRVVRDY